MSTPEITIDLSFDDGNGTSVTVQVISSHFNIFANIAEPDYYNWSIELPLSFVEHFEIGQAIRLNFYERGEIRGKDFYICEKFAYTETTGVIRLRYQ